MTKDVANILTAIDPYRAAHVSIYSLAGDTVFASCPKTSFLREAFPIRQIRCRASCLP